MRLWTYAPVKRAEHQLHRRILTHCKRHECSPVQFNLAIVDNCATQADGSRSSDCITTTLGEKSQIPPGELPGDRDAADRLLRQFKQLCKSRSVDQKGEFARDRVGTDYEPVAPSAADHPGKIECLRWR